MPILLLDRGFHYAVASALFLFSSAKFWTLLNETKLLRETDPLLGFPFFVSIAIAAVLEAGTAVICLSRPRLEGLIAVFWLSGTLVLYRLSFWWVGWQKPCSCMGSLTDALHISTAVADSISQVFLGVMLVGSTCLLIYRHR